MQDQPDQSAANIAAGLDKIAQAISESGNGWLELVILPALGFLAASIVGHYINLNSAAYERHKAYQEKIFDLLLDELGKAITHGVAHANQNSAQARKALETIIRVCERNLRIYSHIVYKETQGDNEQVSLCKRRVEKQYMEFYRQLTGGNFESIVDGIEPERAAEITTVGSGLRADLLKLRNEELIAASNPISCWYRVGTFCRHCLSKFRPPTGCV